MYNTTQYGVRRAHSFDSYDNLERWQAIREHRKQFLSTRAKFDKLPPSEPPPPPPRQSSKFRILIPTPSSSAVNQLIQNLNEEVKNHFFDKETENYSFRDQQRNEDEQNQKNVENFPRFLNDIDQSTSYNSFKINTFQNANEHNQFKALESPGNVLKLTQSWQKYKANQSVEINEESKQFLPAPTVQESKETIDQVNEPLITRKKVDELGYEQPTFFKDINVSKSVLRPGLKPTVSRVYVSNTVSSDLLGTRVLKTTLPSSKMEVPSPRKTTESLKSDYTRNEQYAPSKLPNSFVSSVSKNDICQNKPIHDLNRRPKYTTEENRRIYLESTLKMFADDLDPENSDSFDSSSVTFSSVRPRRISTGSMHEPINWRSQPPVTPVKVLVQKYNNEAKSNYRL